ncbi:MAG: prepilin peptidase [Verrucomicrobiota bacterium]
MPELTVSLFLTVTSIALGATIGSFLNVCIYRMPRDLSVNQPRRSFCPNCKKGIAWYLNIPVLSWLFLRGKCSNCSEPISARYPLIEALTAVLFLVIWLTFPPFVAIAYWFLISLFIVATFIDFEHYIIPDEITIGGAILGIIASGLVPALMKVDNAFHSLGLSIFGAFVGFGLLYAVILLGKVAFGRSRVTFEEPEPWTIDQPNEDEDPILTVGEDKVSWGEIFYRPKMDRLRISGPAFALDGRSFEGKDLTIYWDRCHIDGEDYPLEEIKKISGKAESIVIPREAMGEGDAKYMACVGAFLGWQAVPFTLFAGSITGSLAWIIGRLIGKADLSKKIPFGPYLTVGAIIWMFWGPDLVQWYQSRL